MTARSWGRREQGDRLRWRRVAYEDVTHVPIEHNADVVAARREAKAVATRSGFAGSDLTVIATAVSEIARNIVMFAGHGEIDIRTVRHGGKAGIVIVAHDTGPGIADLELAMREGFSTGKSLGVGLSGAKRLMDEFEISSVVGKGTTVTMKKWTR